MYLVDGWREWRSRRTEVGPDGEGGSSREKKVEEDEDRFPPSERC